MKNSCLISFIYLLVSGCVSVPMPPGQENNTSFTRQTTLPLVDAYRLLDKQATLCYQNIGLFGNGMYVKSALDTQSNIAFIDIYYLDPSIGGEPDDNARMFRRKITITGTPNGASIVSSGATPKIVYAMHETIPVWLRGEASCSPQYIKRQPKKRSDYEF